MKYECRIEKNKSLDFSKHRRGFTTYSQKPSLNSVLILTAEESAENTSVRLARELVLELKSEPATNIPLSADEWIVKGLYKFGGPQLQFESQKVSGSLILTSVASDGTCHGSLDLTFSDPEIDIANMQHASLKVQF